MSVIHGKDIKIYNNDGTALIAGAKSCIIHKSAETIETASTSATDKSFIPGRTEWSVDLSYLVTSGLNGLPLVGTTYRIKVMVSGSQVVSGMVICTSCDIQASIGNLSTGSIKMQGTGPLA